MIRAEIKSGFGASYPLQRPVILKFQLKPQTQETITFYEPRTDKTINAKIQHINHIFGVDGDQQFMEITVLPSQH